MAATNVPNASTGATLEEYGLPQAVISRIFKAAVPDGVILSKDAKTALVASTTVFINYLAATANDVASGKSKTLTSAAVLQALDELGFEDFVGPVRAAIDAHKASAQEKRQAQTEKRKAKEAVGEDAAGADAKEGDASMDEDGEASRKRTKPAAEGEEVIHADAGSAKGNESESGSGDEEEDDDDEGEDDEAEQEEDDEEDEGGNDEEDEEEAGNTGDEE